ncbi:uncharacterized protein LOC131010923 isoform X1 [Salvia miltiorrhiza]|uniref:uncharacterized protein LOC131010923 isoform X1 n=1 Tax=Salvia miltiorrhiza TaxID=226208 RepID=UPI0025ACBD1A|nr:uncharacterized protein LOC131010923 isoform X1 [Salvia miltiorrhiza]
MMEKISEDLQSEKLKSQTAIRCAKAAMLLSSLKNATKALTTDVPQLQVYCTHTDNKLYAFQVQDELKIEKLMFELAKEKQKLKKLRNWIRISILFYFIVLFIYPIFLIFL